jgi:MFS family permease
MPVLAAWLEVNSTLGADAGLAYGVVTGLVAGLVFGPWLGRSGKPRALAIRLSGPRQYRRLIVISLLVVIGLLSFGSLALAFSWLFLGFAIVPAVWLAFEVRSLLSIPAADVSSATAASTYRADRIASLATGLMAGLAFGLAAAAIATTVSAGIVSFLGNWLDAAVPLGCTVAVAAALLTGQVPRLKFTEIILALRYRDRIDFPQLLEEASRQQLLRQAGVVYQFRHAALQDRLAATRISPDQH